MKRGMFFTGLAAALTLLAIAAGVGAQMTSPYLVGEWEMFRHLYDRYNDYGFDIPLQTQFKVMNPTTTTLDVYAVLLDRYGNPTYNNETEPPTLVCYAYQLKSNATWKPCFPFFDAEDNLTWPNEKHRYGAVKFFAFPSGTTKFDPNAVVAGYQQKFSWNYQYDHWDNYGFWTAVGTETPLLSVSVNSRNIGEFTKFPLKSCQGWRTWSYKCADNYFEEEER